jgi:hypothetical protein
VLRGGDRLLTALAVTDERDVARRTAHTVSTPTATLVTA